MCVCTCACMHVFTQASFSAHEHIRGNIDQLNSFTDAFKNEHGFVELQV